VAADTVSETLGVVVVDVMGDCEYGTCCGGGDDVEDDGGAEYKESFRAAIGFEPNGLYDCFILTGLVRADGTLEKAAAGGGGNDDEEVIGVGVSILI
jgi:hypothetical protein